MKIGLDVEAAWAAGFFDGEGCVFFSDADPNRVPRVQCSVAQVDRRVLDRFCVAVGVGSVGGPYVKADRPECQPYHMWMTSSLAAVKQVFQTLEPFLDSIKSEAFVKSIESAEWSLANLKCRSCGGIYDVDSAGRRKCSRCRSEIARMAVTERWAKDLRPETPCSKEDCEAVAKIKGLCNPHYMKSWRKKRAEV